MYWQLLQQPQGVPVQQQQVPVQQQVQGQQQVPVQQQQVPMQQQVPVQQTGQFQQVFPAAKNISSLLWSYGAGVGKVEALDKQNA